MVDIAIPGLLPGKTVFGVIDVNMKYLSYFTPKEWHFIICHECIHIHNNHFAARAFWFFTKTLAKGPKNENAQLLDSIRILLALISKDHLPPDAITIRDQEYEADEWALSVTNDIKSAESCLSKMSNGDLNNASHVWDVLDRQLATMSLKERIQEMRKRFHARNSLNNRYV